MNITVFIGGNKDFTASRLGVKLAEALQAAGHLVTVRAVKGKIKSAPGVTLKEYAAIAKPKTLAAALKKENAEFVISFMNLTGCEAAVEASVPFVYAEEENFKEDKPVKTKKVTLKKAKQVFVIRTSDKPLAKKNYTGLPVMELTAPAIGVEHCNYNKPACFKKENNILAIGRLTKESGFDALLRTWARLAPGHASWHLTIVGDGTAKTALKKFIAKNNLQASTEIVPETEDVYNLLRHADIFAYSEANPSRADILLDAMASKLPCVAYASAPAEPLVTSGVNGVLVSAAKEEPFMLALDELMVSWGRRVNIAVEAGKLKDKYPFADFVRAFLKSI